MRILFSTDHAVRATIEPMCKVVRGAANDNDFPHAKSCLFVMGWENKGIELCYTDRQRIAVVKREQDIVVEHDENDRYFSDNEWAVKDKAAAFLMPRKVCVQVLKAISTAKKDVTVELTVNGKDYSGRCLVTGKGGATDFDFKMPVGRMPNYSAIMPTACSPKSKGAACLIDWHKLEPFVKPFTIDRSPLMILSQSIDEKLGVNGQGNLHFCHKATTLYYPGTTTPLEPLAYTQVDIIAAPMVTEEEYEEIQRPDPPVARTLSDKETKEVEEKIAEIKQEPKQVSKTTPFGEHMREVMKRKRAAREVARAKS